MLTASSSQKIHKTKKQAQRARKTGLTFLVIGVGSKINEEELRIITGPGAVPETDNVSGLGGSSAAASCSCWWWCWWWW